MEDGLGRAYAQPRLTKASAAEFSSSSEEDDDEHLLPGLDATDDGFGDFNPRKRRRVGGNSKEKDALGIFGSDSDDDRPGQRWKRKTLRSKGMNFVATASKNRQSDVENNSPVEEEATPSGNASSTKEDAESEDEDDDDDDDDDDEYGNTGVGLGFGPAVRSSQGFLGADLPNSQAADDTKPSIASTKTNFDAKGFIGGGFVSSSAAAPVLSEEAMKNASPPRNKPQPSAFGRKGNINAKSFGARMMAKMGYVEGAGLGKEAQGRNVIIEANLRPQGAGLGAVKEKTKGERDEEKRQARLRGEEVIDSEEEEKKQRRRAKKKSLGITDGSASSTPRRQKTKYLTAEELKAAAPGLHIPEAFTPILDMTGPGSKSLTSASGILTPKSGISEPSGVVEARKLFKRAQADLAAFSEEWRNLEERKSWLNLELKEKEQELEQLGSDLQRLQDFSTFVSDELTKQSDWHQVMECLRKAANLGSSINTEMADVAVAAIHPILKTCDWSPLHEPARFATELKDVSILFGESNLGNTHNAVSKPDSAWTQMDGSYRLHHKATTTYETMMYKVWLPRILAAIREWSPLDPAPMLGIMESWDGLLPRFVRAQVIDHVARKLETAVADWNPRKGRQSQHTPHSWLFPWLPFLPAYHVDPKGTGLVSDVKRKYRKLIDVWEYERGVVPGLEQWRDVLGDEWRPLIMSHVLPSMSRYLERNFVVEPAQQEPCLPVLTGILQWRRVIGVVMMAEVLARSLFPSWNAKLQEWLALEDANLGEIAEWYTWWRGTVFEDLADAKGVCEQLDKGLRVMNLV